MHAITVHQLHKRYGDHVAVHDLSFTVEEGEILAIVGPNGAGKTTTVEALQGLRPIDGGTVRVLGWDPTRDRAQIRQRVGTQLQSSKLQDKLTVIEALQLFTSLYERPADPEELLATVGLGDQRHTRFARLSGGQQQRLSIALALGGGAEIAVFDEITTGLDPTARRATWDLIRRIRDSGVTVLLVTHSMEEAERLADRVAIIAAGRLVALDTPEALVRRVGTDQRVHLRATTPIAPAVVAGVPGVEGVTAADDELVVTGTGALVPALMTALLRAAVPVTELRLEQPTLDDAYLALTSSAADAPAAVLEGSAP